MKAKGSYILQIDKDTGKLLMLYSKEGNKVSEVAIKTQSEGLVNLSVLHSILERSNDNILEFTEVEGALSNIKLQLFDAPDEVKSSFNRLVKHFSEDFIGNENKVAEVVVSVVLEYLRTGYEYLKSLDVVRSKTNISSSDLDSIYKKIVDKLKAADVYSSHDVTYRNGEYLRIDKYKSTYLVIKNSRIELYNKAIELFKDKIKK